MNIKHKKPTLTKKQRHKLRVQQVRRQKIFLTCLFLLIVGCILLRFSKFSGRQEEAHQINAACEAYRDEVSSEAAQYDMSKYVDLILAVMMQESSGHGADVMQSSEGAYNTEYPQEPNGITDVDYSIRCGIQELKYAMEKAGVTSPSDISHIKLALQAYNFGADSYFNYLRNHGITEWSVSSSEAFAQMASGNTARSQEDTYYNTAGPWDYGDQYYPEHVLRYYHPK